LPSSSMTSACITGGILCEGFLIFTVLTQKKQAFWSCERDETRTRRGSCRCSAADLPACDQTASCGARGGAGASACGHRDRHPLRARILAHGLPSGGLRLAPHPHRGRSRPLYPTVRFGGTVRTEDRRQPPSPGVPLVQSHRRCRLHDRSGSVPDPVPRCRLPHRAGRSHLLGPVPRPCAVPCRGGRWRSSRRRVSPPSVRTPGLPPRTPPCPHSEGSLSSASPSGSSPRGNPHATPWILISITKPSSTASTAINSRPISSSGRRRIRNGGRLTSAS